jgi:lipid-A-disaccharide synthase
MRVFVSAAEISSDLQAEQVIRSFRELYPDREIEFFGIAGPCLRRVPGFRVLERAESLRTMGFVEVLSKYFFFRRTLSMLCTELERTPPDVILTVDYPEFHFSLMKKLRKRSWFRGAVRICGIPPKVWVWRSRRLEKIRELYHGVWVIFPFERNFYEDRGIPVIFEGNPLIADLLSKAVPKEPLLSADEIRVAVLPGSRDAELKAHLPLVGPTLNELSQLTGKQIHAEVPLPRGLEESVFSRELVSTDRVHYRLIPGGSAEVLSRNSIGLIKSGTATLEAAVLGCVPVIFYRMSPVSEWIFRRWVRYEGPVGLPNILLGIKERARSLFPEFLGTEARPDLLATALYRLIDQPEHTRMLSSKGEELKRSLVPHSAVSGKIAERLHEWIIRPPVKPLQRPRSIRIALVSFLWSSVNRIRRLLRAALGIRTPALPVKSILVGNLQAGGAGKTPMVIELARAAIARGYRVGVLSRGYGRAHPRGIRRVEAGDDPCEIGDEPAEIKAALPEVPLVLGANRLRASRELSKEGVDLIIADDGYQNLGFRADVTMLLVTDAARNELPYRDFDSEAIKADYLVQTKGAGVGRFPYVRRLGWKPVDPPSGPLWLWTAIADPSEMIDFYERNGITFRKLFLEKDHAVPDPAVIQRILDQASAEGVRLAITPKDAAKIPPHLRVHCVVLRRILESNSLFDEIFEGLQ